MSEIKSTLDLVLEKTRHLKLSEEEKSRSRRETAMKNLRAVFQRYQDGLIPLPRLLEELERLKAGMDRTDERLILNEALERIRLNADNTAMLAYLQTASPSAVQQIKQVLADYAQNLEMKEAERTDRLLGELEAEHGITGSAVAPNLQNDAKWKQLQADVRTEYERRLEAAKTAMVESPNSSG
jgi:hypothetical protein